MKSALFKEMSYPLPKLMEDIDMGVIGLPDIQRPFVWKASQVRDLFDSMYKGFPVGYLLFWANGAGNGHKQIGTNIKQKVPQVLIVDGQQRLTSLYAVLRAQPVLTADYKQERIEIAFRPKDAKFEVADAAVKKDPEFIANISEMWSKYGGSYSFIKDYMKKLKASREVMPEEEESIAVSIDKLWDVQNYTFSALELSSNITEEQVAEVFVRINSKGVQLKQADFILTLMSVFWDEGRRELERFCREARVPTIGAPSPFNYFLRPDPDELLRVSVGLGFSRARLQHVYSILRGKDLDTEEFSPERRDIQFEVLKTAQAEVLKLQNWHEFLKALMAAGYRSAEMVTSRVGVLYSYILFLVGKRDGIEQYRLRNLIARWFFAASLTARYSSSPESQMEGDFLKLRNIKPEQLEEALDQIIADTLTEDFWNITLPNNLATSSARSPSLYAYYAALNLLGARALFSNLSVYDLLDPALQANKKATERHHLFPKNYLKKMGITEVADVNQIANFALLEWADNIKISDRSPVDYFPKYARERCSGAEESEELRNMRFWHALPANWERMPYQDFLTARRKRMANVIRAGYGKLAHGTTHVMTLTTLDEVIAAPSRLALVNPFVPSGSRHKIFNILLDGNWHSISAIQAHFSVDVRHRLERIKIRGEKTREWRIEEKDDGVRMIATPDEASTLVEPDTDTDSGPSLKRRKQLKFWEEFKAYVEKNSEIRCQSAKAQAWLVHPIGRSSIYLASTVSPDLRAVLVVDSSDAKQQFAALERRKDEIERSLGFPLIWSNPSDRRRCQIYVKRDADLYNEENWSEQFSWLKMHLENLKRVFGSIVNNAGASASVAAGMS